jgi:GDPmannose 4,6-dehydratase
MRPTDPVNLVGDCTKARERLGWEPRTGFDALIELMVEADLDLLAASGTAHSPA